MISAHHHDPHRRLLGRLQHDAVAGGERRRHLPGRHQQREVPRDDLADDAERLMEMVGVGGVVDLADRPFLGADAAGEVAEVVDGERQVGGRRLADRLAVVERLDHRQHRQPLLHAVGDLVENARALGGRCLGPGVLGGMRGIERLLDVLGGRAGDLAQRPAGHRRQVREVLAAHRRHPFAADEVVVFRPNDDALLQFLECLMDHGTPP